MSDLIAQLGYEQIRALMILNTTPDIEGVALCAQADCSWEDMFRLAEAGLIDAGADRLAPMRIHPTLTDAGRKAVEQGKAAGFGD
jgi:hypothetical protein